MNWFRVLPLLVLVLISLGGCAAVPADPLAYQNDAAQLTLTGQIGDLAYAAELTLAAVPEGASVDERDFVLAYTAPASLCGLTITRAAGETTLTRGAVCQAVPDGRWDSMADPAALFCIDCDLGRAAVIEQNGTTLNRIEAADDEGSYVLWLDESGFPRRIEGAVGDRTVVADILRQPSADGAAE